MQANDTNQTDDQPRKSSGMIRGAIFGVMLLLAVFGLIAAITKLTNNQHENVATLVSEINPEEQENTFNRLTSEWAMAKTALQNAKDTEKTLAQQFSEMHTNGIAQETILKEAEAAFTRALEAITTSTIKAENADSEMTALLDDTLEDKVANAAGNFDAYKANWQRAQASLKAASKEHTRINAAVVELQKASEAADVAAKATETVVHAADAAQIIVDKNEDIIPDTDGSTLTNLRNYFFNEAKAQADTAKRSANAASKALSVSTQKLRKAEKTEADHQAALDFIKAEEQQSEQELQVLARQLEDLQAQRIAAQKKAAIAHQRVITEQAYLDQRKSALSEEVLKNETLKAASKTLEKEYTAQEIKVGAAQEIYNDAEARLRSAQKLRAKYRATKIAVLNSEMHDTLRATLGNLHIENPDHDRFIVSSEALFESGSAKLGKGGKALVLDIAKVVISITKKIPSDMDWMLRVDGHTDTTPLSGNGSYKDNWELSQARALAIVRSLISQGDMSPDRLAANGLGEYQPLKSGNSDQDKAKNRRIELVLVPR